MKKLLLYILLFSLFLIFFGVIFYINGISSPGGNGNSSEFVIKPGSGVNVIARDLKEEGYISSPLFFKIYVWQNKLESKLMAGRYSLSPEMSIREIVQTLAGGQVVNEEISIRIIEGWKIRDIDEYLKKNGIINDDSFLLLATAKVSDWQFGFSKPDFLEELPESADLEGFLFPDTYKIQKNTAAEDIIKKMLSNFGNKISGEFDETEPGDFYDILIMASIIEKEVPQDDDRKLVSGILWKRLDVGMKLGIDATINYLTGKNNPSSFYSDLEIDSPYNTYKYAGLPPGPISNPGLSAIRAAADPRDSEYFFYLNRQDTGETIFSITFEEHIRNKNKYLK